MEKTLTVCVAAYNIERYIDDLMESLIASRVMEDIEILLIDDGSSDNTFEKAADYQQRFPKTVRLISKQNGGHGSALNMGIREAAGKYFRTLDGDDWVDPINFAYLVRCIKHIDADAVLSDIYSCRPNGKIQKEYFPALEDDTLYTFDQLASTVQWMSYHTIVFRTELLRSAGFALDEHCYYVDTEYITYPVPFVETVRFLPDFVYRYRINRAGQSMGVKQMQKYAENYDHVFGSLLRFYDSEIVQSCGAKKKRYIANIIARTTAARIRVFLSLPTNRENKEALIRFDESLKKDHPEIYRANINKAVSALRKSNYLLYRPAAAAVKEKYGQTTV